jgi:hypothetical protein
MFFLYASARPLLCGARTPLGRYCCHHENYEKRLRPPRTCRSKDKPLIYTAMSKHLFYYRIFISVFVLENGGVPLNPFMVFDCSLLDAVNRDLVREGNNNLVKRCDEIWVFRPAKERAASCKPVYRFDKKQLNTILRILAVIDGLLCEPFKGGLYLIV